jgi:hypothetical protein
VYPDDKIIEVWRMLEDDKMSVQVFTVEMTLTAEDVLPGFKLVLAELFPKENL